VFGVSRGGEFLVAWAWGKADKQGANTVKKEPLSDAELKRKCGHHQKLGTGLSLVRTKKEKLDDATLRRPRDVVWGCILKISGAPFGGGVVGLRIQRGGVWVPEYVTKAPYAHTGRGPSQHGTPTARPSARKDEGKVVWGGNLGSALN